MRSCQVRFGSGLSEIVESDLVVSGDPKASCEVSKYPIEDGAQLSDHVILQNRGISLQLFFAAVPQREGLQPAGPQRPEMARRRLLAASQRGEVCQVVWDNGAYYPAILTSVSSPRDANVDGRWVTIEVEEIQVAESQSVKVPKKRLKSGVRHKHKTVDKGPKTSITAAQAAVVALKTAQLFVYLPIP